MENSTKRGKLFVLSGPSGTGKGTVCKQLLSQMQDIGLSISATTRSPRMGEMDGKDYFFLSKDEFQAIREQGGFLESAEFSGNFYGTPKDYVETSLQEGRNILLEIEAQGAGQIKEKMPEAILIFLYPPSMEELERRLRQRGTESAASIERRLKRAEEEMELIQLYDYAVENDQIEMAVEKISAIIAAEKYRVNKEKKE